MTTREEIAKRFDLPMALAARLRGDTPRELERDAAALAALRPRSSEPPHTSEDILADGLTEFKNRTTNDHERVKRRLGLNDER